MLRTVHLLFISLSALLALIVAAWAFEQYRTGASPAYAGAAAGALAGAVLLVAYAVRFRRRSRYW